MFSLPGLVVLLLIVGVVLALVPVDATIKRILIIVIVVILVFALLHALSRMGWFGGPWV